MLRKDVGFLKYRKIIKDASGFIYNDHETGRMIKLDKDCADDMIKKYGVSVLSSKINENQISELSKKQISINNTSLPSGVMYFNNIPVGVIYPRFYNGYNTFEELYKEEPSLIIKNLKKAYYNNMELINNDICNKDFSFKNIMYKNDDVRLIDLDGKMIGNRINSTYTQLYYYYLEGIYYCIKKRLELLYGDKSKEIVKELKSFILSELSNIKIDTPLYIIDEIEKKKILK